MATDFFLDILHIDFISNDNRKESIFKELLNSLQKEYYAATPNFEVNFKTAYSFKRKYYKAKIDYETISKFNKMIEALDIQSTEVHLQFLFSRFYDDFTNYLKNIYNYIQQNNIDEQHYLNPSNDNKSDEAYLTYYLKANAMMLFLELQSRFGNHSNEHQYTPEEIHEVFFLEDPPKQSLVVPYSGSEVPIKTKPKSTSSGKFTAIKGDLENRPENTKIPSFEQLISTSKSTQFASFEVELNESGIIDNTYNFNPKKGNKQILAAFILKLKNLNYFNERIFPGNKPITDRLITKFFAHRYGPGSDTDKEVRNFKTTKKHKFYSLIQNTYWLDKIR